MEPRSFVPKGAASFRVDYDGPAKDIYFLLLPKLTMLAFSSAVEPLRIANQVANKELYRWFLITEDGQPVRCSNGIEITPDFELRNLPRSSRIFACAGIEPSDSANPKVLAWISRQRTFGCHFGGICTGAFALAKAGLLRDRTFTLHWENQPSFSEFFPGLEPTSNLYEIDRDLMTCGGGNAAIDMMLDMIETDHGNDLAVIVSDMCIHFRSNNRKAPQKSAYSVALSSRNQHLINAMQYMEETIEELVDITEIAEHAQISRRQLERLFQRYVGTSPVQFYIELRVARAHALLNETDMSVAEIAAATGFSSATRLTVRFKQRFGQSPSAFRKSWADKPDGNASE
ncbi:MAG: GlxA family transcriptional regulator [Ruegeria sp.]|uniref:GlxA family transcriptional regulator n=1 Tax=Ruegeria sp. TaxID=1879320 RepID=UPI00349E8A77